MSKYADIYTFKGGNTTFRNSYERMANNFMAKQMNERQQQQQRQTIVI